MVNRSILYPDDHVPAIAYIPVSDPDGRKPGDLIFHSRAKKKKINESDTDKVKATKLIQNGMITVRDCNILKSLLGVGIFTREQVQRLFWEPGNSKTVVQRRLRLLVERELVLSTMAYLDMLEQLGMERCSLYGLDSVGREVIALREQMQSATKVSYSHQYYVLADNRIIRHHVMTSEIFTQLKVKSNRVGNEMLWINEMDCILRDKNETVKELVRPDGYAEIWRDGFEDTAHLFVETDTRNTDWEKKIESYELAYARGNWQESLNTPWFPLVLCIVPTPQAVKRVGSLIKERARNVTYLLKAWPQFLMEDPYIGWHHVQGDDGVEIVKILPDTMVKKDA
jgi:hypothetical protein